MRKLGYGVRNLETRIWDVECGIQICELESGIWNPKFVKRIAEFIMRNPESGIWKVKCGILKFESGIQNLETGI